jgi:hypothetical protein
MISSIDMLFLVAMAFLFVHELDAIQQHEWRFFFALLPVSDTTAYRIFIAAHVPLFVLIIWNMPSSSFQTAFDLFLIFHAVLHWALRNHPKIKFNDRFSQFWIFGGALLGAIHLVMRWIQ